MSLESNPNPYAPPTSELLEPEGAPAVEELATTGQRFVNYLIDSIGYFALSVLAGALSTLVAPEPMSLVSNYVVSFAVFVLYWGLSEALTGQTPAKLITRTRVVSATGGPPSVSQIAGRTLVRMVPFEPFSFLGARNGRPVGWHDAWSKTRVVRLR